MNTVNPETMQQLDALHTEVLQAGEQVFEYALEPMILQLSYGNAQFAAAAIHRSYTDCHSVQDVVTNMCNAIMLIDSNIAILQASKAPPILIVTFGGIKADIKARAKHIIDQF